MELNKLNQLGSLVSAITDVESNLSRLDCEQSVMDDLITDYTVLTTNSNTDKPLRPQMLPDKLLIMEGGIRKRRTNILLWNMNNHLSHPTTFLRRLVCRHKIRKSEGLFDDGFQSIVGPIGQCLQVVLRGRCKNDFVLLV